MAYAWIQAWTCACTLNERDPTRYKMTQFVNMHLYNRNIIKEDIKHMDFQELYLHVTIIQFHALPMVCAKGQSESEPCYTLCFSHIMLCMQPTYFHIHEYPKGTHAMKTNGLHINHDINARMNSLIMLQREKRTQNSHIPLS